MTGVKGLSTMGGPCFRRRISFEIDLEVRKMLKRKSRSGLGCLASLASIARPAP